MSTRSRIRALVVAAAAAAALAAGVLGLSGAASVEGALEGAMPASTAPPLLGPITESGRTGWACKPEQAAAAKSAAGGELPAAGASP